MPSVSRPRSAYATGLAIAILGSVFFSGKAVVAKLLYRYGIDAVTLIALRMLLSAPAFLIVAAWSWRREPRLKTRDLAQIVLLGLLGYYVSSMLDFMGLELVSAGLERLILFLSPSFVLLLGLLVFKRQVTPRQWLSLVFAYGGIVLAFWHDVTIGGADVALGASLVTGAALTYAVYLLLSGELIARVGSLRLASLAMVMSCVAGLLQYALLRPWRSLFDQSLPVWELSLVNAGLCTVLPVFLTMTGVARIGAGSASQAGMIGPVSTLFLAWWLLGEPITTLQLAGTTLVLTGIFLLSTHKIPTPAVAVGARSIGVVS